jgi:alpha-ketoglutarate-dependent taurine dioxygenase
VSAVAESTPHAWNAQTIDPPGRWYHSLSDDCREALRRAAASLAARPGPVTEASLPAEVVERCRGELAPVQEALFEGRGFVIVEGAADPDAAVAPARAACWLLGHALGTPVPQNVAGTLLYDVRDEGGDVARGSRFSVTRAASGFHTDNSFGDDVVDTVGLLCLRTSLSGGISQLVDGHAVLAELRREPGALETLRRPFHVDRRGGVRPGEGPTSLRPVVEGAGKELTYRYLHEWIEAGHAKAGEPMSPEQARALDVLDGVLRRPDLRVEFTLRPGELLLLNNRRLLHSRTAFEDHPEPERGRHYLRLWLRRA